MVPGTLRLGVAGGVENLGFSLEILGDVPLPVPESRGGLAGRGGQRDGLHP